jgi:chromate transport protein ChrA
MNPIPILIEIAVFTLLQCGLFLLIYGALRLFKMHGRGAAQIAAIAIIALAFFTFRFSSYLTLTLIAAALCYLFVPKQQKASAEEKTQ